MARAQIAMPRFLADFGIGVGAVTPHMAFGYGAHHCLGAALACAELQDGLAALAARLTCPTVGQDTAWKPNAGITGPLRLPITFRARSTS